MAKNPADQFYFADWLSDVELQQATSATRGIWMNALCHMWFSKIRGEISGSEESLVRLLNCTSDEFCHFLSENLALGFCYTNKNLTGIITLRNRRMYRKGKEQQNNRLRQKRYYKKRKPNGQPNGDLTHVSSSSSINTTYLYKPNAPKNPPVGEDFRRYSLPPKEPICEQCKSEPSINRFDDGRWLCITCWPKRKQNGD
jgi:hypothetical protein